MLSIRNTILDFIPIQSYKRFLKRLLKRGHILLNFRELFFRQFSSQRIKKQYYSIPQYIKYIKRVLFWNIAFEIPRITKHSKLIYFQNQICSFWNLKIVIHYINNQVHFITYLRLFCKLKIQNQSCKCIKNKCRHFKLCFLIWVYFDI